MTTQADWKRWSEDYRAAGHDPAARRAEWRRRVGRQSLLLRLLVAGEIALTAAVLWLVAHTLSRRTDGAALWWAGSVVVLLIVVWTFALRNRRGTWSPYADTTAAFLALMRERCRRRLNAVLFTWVMLGLTAPLNVFLLTGRWRPLDEPSPAMPPAWAATALVYAVFIAWSVWYRRRTHRELVQVEQALAELQAEVD